MSVKVLDAVCQCRMCETGQGSGFGVDMKIHCPERRARPMGLEAKCKNGCSADDLQLRAQSDFSVLFRLCWGSLGMWLVGPWLRVPS